VRRRQGEVAGGGEAAAGRVLPSPPAAASGGFPAACHFALPAADAKLNLTFSSTIVLDRVGPVQLSWVAAYVAPKNIFLVFVADPDGSKSRSLTYQ